MQYGCEYDTTLVDEDTHINSNVSGRGNDMLDPVIVKKVSFQFLSLTGSEKMSEEWGKCGSVLTRVLVE